MPTLLFVELHPLAYITLVAETAVQIITSMPYIDKPKILLP